MKIAINAADLDHSRIDGTRIYIRNMLKNFGLLDEEDQFLIYHKKEFNPKLGFPTYKNYKIQKLRSFPYWTQTWFALEIFRAKPDVLWMPMHALPLFRRRKTKTVVTIHDLAFKFFPRFFPKKDLRRLNLLTDYAVRNSNRLIAVSSSTKNDILKIYPFVKEEKIKVIHHGYDRNLYNKNVPREKIEEVRSRYGMGNSRYFIFVGAIQPRKNISALIEAFASLRKENSYNDLRLVIAGEAGWLHDGIISEIKKTENVLAIGKFETEDLPALLSGALAFVLPSLYEGFGMPVLEAMATGTPVIAADNSSLVEIVGESGILFKANNPVHLEKTLREVLENGKLRAAISEKGLKRSSEFSWEKSARETLEWLTEW